MSKYLLVCIGALASGCMSKSTGDGTVTVDGASLGAVSAWAEPSGPTLGMGDNTKDYMGWTIHFSHASPGVACGTAPDLTSVADVEIVTAQVDTDSSNLAGKAQRAILSAGTVPIIADYPTTISASFALAGVQGITTTQGTLTISSFDDTSIEGEFSAAGTYVNTVPVATAALTGTFSATRCID
jgi:hypothetical protein